jgi:hypothetical protein
VLGTLSAFGKLSIKSTWIAYKRALLSLLKNLLHGSVANSIMLKAVKFAYFCLREVDFELIDLIPKSSASIFFPESARITARSTAFSSSLTFPGHP